MDSFDMLVRQEASLFSRAYGERERGHNSMTALSQLAFAMLQAYIQVHTYPNFSQQVRNEGERGYSCRGGDGLGLVDDTVTISVHVGGRSRGRGFHHGGSCHRYGGWLRSQCRSRMTTGLALIQVSRSRTFLHFDIQL